MSKPCPFQQALAATTLQEARALYEALDQFTSNLEDHLALEPEDDKATQSLSAAQAVLDRANTVLAKLAEL